MFPQKYVRVYKLYMQMLLTKQLYTSLNLHAMLQMTLLHVNIQMNV